MSGNITCDTCVINGPVNLCLAPYGTDPTSGGFVDLGLTQGSLNITQDNSYIDIETQQSGYIVGRRRTRQSLKVSIELICLPIATLRVLLGVLQGMTPSGDGLCVSVSNGCTQPEEFAMVVCGPGPDCGCRNWYFPRVIFTPDSVDYNSSIEELTSIQIEIYILPECPSGELFCVTDTCDSVLLPDLSTVAFDCSVGEIPDYAG